MGLFPGGGDCSLNEMSPDPLHTIDFGVSIIV